MHVDFETELLGTPSVTGVLVTSGQGSVLAYKGASLSESSVAAWTEVSTSTLETLSRSGVQAGRLLTGVFVFNSATLVVGTFPSGQKVVVLATPDANIGLILSHVRGWISEKVQ